MSRFKNATGEAQYTDLTWAYVPQWIPIDAKDSDRRIAASHLGTENTE